MSATTHARVYISVCSASVWDTGLEPKNVESEPVRTDSVEIETQTVSLFLMLFCSHWQTGGAVWTPLAHFCTAYVLHTSRQKKNLRAAETIWRRWQLFIWFRLLFVLLKIERPCCLHKRARLVLVPSQTNIHTLTPEQHDQFCFFNFVLPCIIV